MRVERLEVAGFGCLRDQRVDFAPGLTVVLGANESGKSSIHRALRAALYGVDAGGQGRAAARSDWARWRPWEGERYGVGLTYALADGRRFRIARRLELREERVQVQELGGREVTDDLRAGRLVAPGVHHLGVDEAVFCASAWVGEEGLEASAPDCPTARADRIQDAIERLADAAGRATAAEALARLRAAADRVGTEQRARSPLGAASARLRSVEAELAAARARLDAVAADAARLAELEAAALAAGADADAAERAWIAARLAAVAAHRDELGSAREEAARLEQSIAGSAAYAAFPVEREERVTALGGELRVAREADAAARARWDAARDEIRRIDRRRAELGTALSTLGSAPRVTDRDRAEADALAAAVAAEAGVERRVERMRTAAARLDALRREAAGLGLGSVPVGAAGEVADLVEEVLAGDGAQRLPGVAAAVAVAAVVVAGALAALHLSAVAAAAGGAMLLVAALLGLAARLAAGPCALARRRLGRLCPGLGLDDEGLRRTRERLPRLAALHDDLRTQQAVLADGRAELEEATARLGELAGRALVLAARLPVEVTPATVPVAGPIAHLERARAALAAVEAAAAAGGRRVELEAEDATLAARSAELQGLGSDANARTDARMRLAAEMARLCDIPGLAAEEEPARQVAAFRQAAATRRHHEAARQRLAEVRRRLSALGPADDEALRRQLVQLGEELARRGGDPSMLAPELPLEPGRLHELETAAADRRGAAVAGAHATTALRERLAGLLEGLPSVADLEDERAACLAVRRRCLHQLEALRRAGEAIEAAARAVHRNVAPRLADGVAAHLALLTDGRYTEVHVDAERFGVALRSPDRLELVSVDLLSHGTRDQVALLLRMSLAGVFGEGGEPLPLLLDDPLQSSDPGRRAGLLDFLGRLADSTQVVLTTSDPEVAAAAVRRRGDATVVELRPGPRGPAAPAGVLASARS